MSSDAVPADPDLRTRTAVYFLLPATALAIFGDQLPWIRIWNPMDGYLSHSRYDVEIDSFLWRCRWLHSFRELDPFAAFIFVVASIETAMLYLMPLFFMIRRLLWVFRGLAVFALCRTLGLWIFAHGVVRTGDGMIMHLLAEIFLLAGLVLIPRQGQGSHPPAASSSSSSSSVRV